MRLIKTNFPKWCFTIPKNEIFTVRRFVYSMEKGATYGAGIGGVVGAVYSYNESKKYRNTYVRENQTEEFVDTYVRSYFYILGGLFGGGWCGFIMGLCWPISVGALLLTSFDNLPTKKPPSSPESDTGDSDNTYGGLYVN